MVFNKYQELMESCRMPFQQWSGIISILSRRFNINNALIPSNNFQITSLQAKLNFFQN